MNLIFPSSVVIKIIKWKKRGPLSTRGKHITHKNKRSVEMVWSVKMPWTEVDDRNYVSIHRFNPFNACMSATAGLNVMKWKITIFRWLVSRVFLLFLA